jgi:peptide chain release factor 1
MLERVPARWRVSCPYPIDVMATATGGDDDRPDRPASGVMSELDDKLSEVARQYDDVQAQLARPEVSADPSEIRRLGRELARLEPVVEAFRRLEAVRGELADLRELRDAGDGDDELRSMARDEIDPLEGDEARLVEELKVLLLPRDPNDDRDVILEIRAGAGGEEAALFANELLRMYLRYADKHKFSYDLMSQNETGIGGIKEAIVEIAGDGAYSRLKFEGGVHRIQRVPSTESSGRIHTSTATVIVMPEADEVEVEIDEIKDLRIDVKRSSGPGGQSVNTTDSAVRITHLPTGLVVEIQDEKSQHKNKAKALSVLRSRLYDLELQKQRAADSAVRRSMVGSGDRSEKVRTYNVPDNRVTDHRIKMTVHDVPGVLQGDLDPLIDALVMADQADRLSGLTGADDAA